MVLSELVQLQPSSKPLQLRELPKPRAGPGQILLKVHVCGVCHTELDEIEGRTAPAIMPMILGHQVVGTVAVCGTNSSIFSKGERVGVAWIYTACENCEYCQTGRENLCSEFRATGRDAYGGYAEYMVVPERFAYPVPKSLTDLQTAPLLCAGAIGYRSLMLTGISNGQRLGLTGFGASAHLVIKMARFKYPDSKIFVFARNQQQRAFARELGAFWVGDTEEQPLQLLDAIIDTTPVWFPVVKALESLKPGGRLVINAIRKENYDQQTLLDLEYHRHLWMERELKSVANITRKDVVEFLQLAAEIPIEPLVKEYSLEQANEALIDLKFKSEKGAKVLRIPN